MCDKDVENAKVTIPTYSQDKYIEFKAYLEEKIVHSDKWVTILFPFIAIAISVISLIANGEPTEQSILKLEIVGILFLGIAVLAVIGQCGLNCKNGKYRKALCYLEEYFQKDDVFKENKNVSEQEISTFEEIIKRQRKERRKILKKWEKNQQFVEHQISLFGNSLDNEELGR